MLLFLLKIIVMKIILLNQILADMEFMPSCSASSDKNVWKVFCWRYQPAFSEIDTVLQEQVGLHKLKVEKFLLIYL